MEEVVVELRKEEAVLTEPRKTRATSIGVAELMNTLKLRKKGPIDKGKSNYPKIGATALGGQTSL